MGKLALMLSALAVLLSGGAYAASCTQTQCVDLQNPSSFRGTETWEHVVPELFVVQQADIRVGFDPFYDGKVFLFASNEQTVPTDVSSLLNAWPVSNGQFRTLAASFSDLHVGFLNDGGDVFLHLVTTDDKDNIGSFLADPTVSRLSAEGALIPLPGAAWMLFSAVCALAALGRWRR